MKSKNIRRFVSAIAMLLLLVLLAAKMPRPVIPEDAAIDSYRVLHYVPNAENDKDIVEFSLTDEQAEAVGDLLRGQKCRRMLADPFPISLANYEWELDFMVGDKSYHMDLGLKDFVYFSGTFGNIYYRLPTGDQLTADLNELLLDSEE